MTATGTADSEVEGNERRGATCAAAVFDLGRRPGKVEPEQRAAIVVAENAGGAPAARIAELLGRDSRFRVTSSISEAIRQDASLVVTAAPASILDESDLLARARQSAIAAIFVADEDSRRVALLRAGASDVLSSRLCNAEIVCRIERALDAAARYRAMLARELELETLAYTDPLTGLSNRRFFDEILKREIGRANRYRRPMSLVLIDIDHFKRINDLLGHAAGDVFLAQVAGAMKKLTRICDCAARLGGDELGAILADIDASGARTYATRIVEALSGLAIIPEMPEIRCSLSIGISSYGLEPTTPAELMRRADRALYRAKARGRGRIEIERW